MKKINTSVFLLVIVAILLIIFIGHSFYSDLKDKYINVELFGNYSSSHYLEKYKPVEIEQLELTDYNKLFKENGCKHTFNIKQSNYYNKGKGFSHHYIFNLDCKDNRYNRTIQHDIKADDNYSNFEFIYISKYNEGFVLKNELEKYSKEEFDKLIEKQDFKMFINEVKTELDKAEKQRVKANIKIDSWN